MFKQKNGKKLPPINTTALPDIIFMLLFFFMVVTVIRKDETTSEIKVPQVHFAELSKGKNLIQVSVTMDNKDNKGCTYRMDKKSFTDLKDLEKALASRYLDTESPKIILKADKNISMQKINALKTTFQKAQYYNVEYMATTTI